MFINRYHNMTNVSGIGDCKITHNSLYNDPLRIYSIGDIGVRICHREYIQNVITGTANTFNLQSFPLNPGLPQVFPWLSKIAIGFEQYKINGMIWEFRSTSANAFKSNNNA